jgi:hypothetical protein
MLFIYLLFHLQLPLNCMFIVIASCALYRDVFVAMMLEVLERCLVEWSIWKQECHDLDDDLEV